MKVIYRRENYESSINRCRLCGSSWRYVCNDNFGSGCTFFIYTTRSARADASLRQRAEAPMARAALSRSESSYDNLNGVPMDALPQEAVSFPIDQIVITSSEPVFKKYRNRLKIYNHNKHWGRGGLLFYKSNYKSKFF